jgi:hypothetical protein
MGLMGGDCVLYVWCLPFDPMYFRPSFLLQVPGVLLQVPSVLVQVPS